MGARRLSPVPRPVRLALALALAAQLLWHGARPEPAARPRALPPAPPLAVLQLASLGEPVALAKLIMLYLQADDDQAGSATSLRALDYGRIAGWLARVLELDPRGQYPLLAASQVYGAVDEPARARLMLEFVYRQFDADPDRRWPWLAHAAVVARHRLRDPALARKYAQAIRLRAGGPAVPDWARELELFLLDDASEAASARALIGGLLREGRIRDPHELAFLARRLDALAAREARRRPLPGGAPGP